MKVKFIVYCTTEMYESHMTFLPNVGDVVILYGTRYKVKERIFDGISDEVSIIIDLN